MPKSSAAPWLALLAAGFLAACGGGGGSPPVPEHPPSDPDSVPPAVTEPPATETPVTETPPPDPSRLLDPGDAARLLALLDAGLPEPVTEEASLRRRSQDRKARFTVHADPSHPDPGGIEDVAIGHWNGSDARDARHGILSKGGLTLKGNRSEDGRALWADMDHAEFYVFAAAAPAVGIYADFQFVPSHGPPDSSAAWRGLMAGADRGSGALLAGDAEIRFDFGAMAVDAAFTGIADIGRVAPHTSPEVRFSGVPVHSDGTWEQRGAGRDLVSGAFAGPGREEAAGYFWAQGMVASFGAVRVDE